MNYEHDSECGHCGRTWSSIKTPTPSARCPFEYDHDYPEYTARETLTDWANRVALLMAEDVSHDWSEELDELDAIQGR